MKHVLKANIREEITNIPANMLVKVMANIRNRFIQWGTSPTSCDFQNCVKQNFKCVLSLWNKNKTSYCLLEKGSYVATPLGSNFKYSSHLPHLLISPASHLFISPASVDQRPQSAPPQSSWSPHHKPPLPMPPVTIKYIVFRLSKIDTLNKCFSW